MAYSEALNLLFVHVPKCAGTSVIEAMRAVDPTVDHGHLPWRHYQGLPDVMARRPVSFAVCRNPWARAYSSYRFAVMRESYWHGPSGIHGVHSEFELLSGRTFAEAIRLLHEHRELLALPVGDRPFFKMSWSHQHEFVTASTGPPAFARPADEPSPAPGEVAVDRLYPYEQMVTLERWLADAYGLQVGRLNTSGDHADHREVYDSATIDLVAEVYADDIGLLGYDFDTVLPSHPRTITHDSV